MKTQHIFIITLLISALAFTTSCSKKEGCTDPNSLNYDPDADKDDGSCTYATPTTPTPTSGKLTFNFTHNFDGAAVSSSNFNQFDFVNLNDDTLSISKLRYLISDVRLFKSNGDSILIDGYQLVDVTNSTGLTYAPTDDIPFDSYTGISFTFGFDSLDNTGNYADLNSASWNWPTMIGGGYHFMQMEGQYKELGNDSIYAYHNGHAFNMMNSTSTLNYFVSDLGAIDITNDATIEIKMDIAEWYKNPNTWDLNALHGGLMMNYSAQRMMNANGQSVFSLGTVTQ